MLLKVRMDNTAEQVIKGVVKRVTFRNPQNGYSVLQLTVSEVGQPLTVVGTCLEAGVGSHLLVRGTYKVHPKFGRQLSATSITPTEPSSADGIEKFLSSGLIKGIGAKTAERIVSKFGDKALEILHQDPTKIASVPGIGPHKANLIATVLKDQSETRESLRFLVERNIATGLATRIYERYKTKTVELVTRDPYYLARDMRGIGFKTADDIALNMGFKPDSPQRIKAGLYHALEKASDDGHCFLETHEVSEKARMLLGLEQGIDLSSYLKSLIDEEFVVQSGEALYLRHLYRAEEFVAKFVAERLSPSKSPPIESHRVERCLAEAEREMQLTFSPAQKEAVELASKYRLLVITGGPGCGKTTIIRALTTLYKNAGKRVVLAAPTGRASQRMAQVCGMPASTIHRLLRYDPISGHFQYGVNDPLVLDALIIDEASMMDIQLAKDLFSAIPSHATLILVGDKDQLPSVGPGRVFGDLIAVQEVKTVSLTQLFRRSVHSRINEIAHMINAGIVPEIPQPDGVVKTDAYFIPKTKVEESAQVIEKLVSESIPKKFGISSKEILVLTPSNRGPLGTQILNISLQNRLNPKGVLDGEQELQVGDIEFRLGDRVCQRVNNYNIDPAGVFNGDVGEIYSVDRKTKSLTVEMWDGRLIRYTPGELGQLSLAYAVTVHRAQGSEVPCVVLALHDSHYALLERQLIYTAITRAKKLLVVVGSKRALMIAVKRATTKHRRTLLRERIRELVK